MTGTAQTTIQQRVAVLERDREHLVTKGELYKALLVQTIAHGLITLTILKILLP